MLYGPVFGGGRGHPDRADRRTCRSSAGRACSRARRPPPASRRSSASSPSRRPATSSSAARRRPASRARPWPASASASSSRPSCSRRSGRGAFFLNAGDLRRLVPDLPARRRGPGRRAPRPSAASRTSASAATSTSSGRRTSCCWRRPGSRSTPRSGCGSASRSSSSRKAEPGLPRPAPDARLRRQPDHDRGDRHRDRLRGRPAVLGQPVQDHAADDDHPVRDPRRRGPGRRPGLVVNHAGGLPLVVPLAGAVLAGGGLFVLAGRDARRRSACSPTSPSASRPTAARSWASTRSSSRSARSPAA